MCHFTQRSNLLLPAFSAASSGVDEEPTPAKEGRRDGDKVEGSRLSWDVFCGRGPRKTLGKEGAFDVDYRM
jgi:hypothetical protein